MPPSAQMSGASTLFSGSTTTCARCSAGPTRPGTVDPDEDYPLISAAGSVILHLDPADATAEHRGLRGPEPELHGGRSPGSTSGGPELLDVEFPADLRNLRRGERGGVLGRLRFPGRGRHLALEVFARSFFADPRDFSAVELVAMFHATSSGRRRASVRRAGRRLRHRALGTAGPLPDTAWASRSALDRGVGRLVPEPVEGSELVEGPCGDPDSGETLRRTVWYWPRIRQQPRTIRKRPASATRMARAGGDDSERTTVGGLAIGLDRPVAADRRCVPGDQ